MLTSRPPDETLKRFCDKQESRLAELTIAEDDKNVGHDVDTFVTKLIGEPAFAQALEQTEDGAQAFAKKAADKAHGNLGYLDALARGIDQAISRNDTKLLAEFVALKELPIDLVGLYAFFLRQIKTSVARERVELNDPETGEVYDKPVWPAVYHPILGVLAVAIEPLDLDLIVRLGGIRTERVWVSGALDRILQFLDLVNGRYRLYHATVAEFLTAERTRDNDDPNTKALYQDPSKMHRQIADYYWRCRENWSKCDSYGLDSLAIHLFKSEDSQRLFQLVDPSWMEARVLAQASSYRGFLADLDVAREEVRRLGRVAKCSPLLLSRAVRVTLVRSCINSVMNAYPPALVAQAAVRGLWPVERALNIARQLPGAGDRAYMYAVLLSAGVSGSARRMAADEGFEAILETHYDKDQGSALAKLAPFLDEPEQIDKAWHVASKIRGKWRGGEGHRQVRPGDTHLRPATREGAAQCFKRFPGGRGWRPDGYAAEAGTAFDGTSPSVCVKARGQVAGGDHGAPVSAFAINTGCIGKEGKRD